MFALSGFKWERASICVLLVCMIHCFHLREGAGIGTAF